MLLVGFEWSESVQRVEVNGIAAAILRSTRGDAPVMQPALIAEAMLAARRCGLTAQSDGDDVFAHVIVPLDQLASGNHLLHARAQALAVYNDRPLSQKLPALLRRDPALLTEGETRRASAGDHVEGAAALPTFAACGYGHLNQRTNDG